MNMYKHLIYLVPVKGIVNEYTLSAYILTYYLGFPYQKAFSKPLASWSYSFSKLLASWSNYLNFLYLSLLTLYAREQHKLYLLPVHPPGMNWDFWNVKTWVFEYL